MKKTSFPKENPSIRVVVELSAGPDSTFVSLSTNISLKLFPAQLSSLTLYLVKKYTETCTPLFLSQWNLSGKYMLLRLNVSNHSHNFSALLEADWVPHTTLKGNDATLFALFKPFIFVVFFCLFVFLIIIIFLLEPLQTKLRNDFIQMCLSILSGGQEFGVTCTVKDVMDNLKNHCYYYGTVKTNTSVHLSSSAGDLSLVSASDVLTDIVEKPQIVPSAYPTPYAHSTCKTHRFKRRAI